MRIFDRIVMTVIAAALLAIALHVWSGERVSAASPLDVNLVRIDPCLTGELPVSIERPQPLEVQGSVRCYQ